MTCRVKTSPKPLSIETLTASYWAASQVLRAPQVNFQRYEAARSFMVWLASADPDEVSDCLRHMARCDLYDLSEKRRPDSTWRRVDEVAAFLVERNRPKSNAIAYLGDPPGAA